MEDKEGDSGSWMLGLGIVVTGLIIIVSVGATSAGYYGEQKVNILSSDLDSQDAEVAGLTPT